MENHPSQQPMDTGFAAYPPGMVHQPMQMGPPPGAPSHMIGVPLAMPHNGQMQPPAYQAHQMPMPAGGLTDEMLQEKSRK